MPKPTNLSRYPAEYYELYELLEERNSHSITFHGPNSFKQASTFRFDIYGFHKALENEDFPKVRLWKSFAINIEEISPEITVVRFHPGTDRKYIGALQDSFKLPDEVIPPKVPEVPLEKEDKASDTLADMGFLSPDPDK